jgi:hypothetical protein
MRPTIQPLIEAIKQLKSKNKPIKSIESVTDQERRRRLNVLFDALVLLSGQEDTSFILESFLLQRRNKKYHQRLTEALNTQNKKPDVIENIRRAHQAASQNNKRQILSLLSGTHTYKQIKEMGFQIKPHNLTSANTHSERYGIGAPIKNPTPPPKKRKMTQDDVKTYHQFLENHSREAAARTIADTPVRYVDGNVILFLI